MLGLLVSVLIAVGVASCWCLLLLFSPVLFSIESRMLKSTLAVEPVLVFRILKSFGDLPLDTQSLLLCFLIFPVCAAACECLLSLPPPLVVLALNPRTLGVLGKHSVSELHISKF